MNRSYFFYYIYIYKIKYNLLIKNFVYYYYIFINHIVQLMEEMMISIEEHKINLRNKWYFKDL